MSQGMSEVLIALSQDARSAVPGKAVRTPVLSIVNGSNAYGGVHAIEKVNFDLCPGEVRALVGENGAGKSTLCKAIAGAIQLRRLFRRRQSGAVRATPRCPRRRDLHGLSGNKPGADHDGGAEHQARQRKAVEQFQEAQHPGAAIAAIPELPHRPGNAGGHARDRQASNGGDRPGGLQQGPHHHLRRTDGQRDARRDRAFL
jgi:ATPase subunit of ABC transporter with duplicated ATPase domains